MSSAILWTFGILTSGLYSTLSTGARSEYKTLASSLSTNAQIYHPGTEEFTTASIRWSAAQTPQYDVIVKVATEEDVQKTILFANTNDKPFLTISGGHGTTSIINRVKNGVGILMSGMSNITIVDDGHAALIEGGVLNGDLISYLWSHDKQTATTGCDCVGYIAPVLGGGHGWLQGKYGLASDQLISARMVLANGTSIVVDERADKDLFWAIRGAGHNFGVVTQIKMHLYDVKPEDKQWAASGFVYTHDKLEDVFALANTWLQAPKKPAGMTHYAVFAFNPEVDPVNPVIMMWIYWQGAEIPSEYTDPLHALSPIAVDASVTNLVDVNTHLLANRDGASCAKGYSRSVVPVSLKKYSLPAVRKVLTIFTNMPLEFRSSVMMLEGFPTNHVEEVPKDSTAFPDRDGKLLLSPVLTWPKNASLDATGWKLGGDIRSALLEGSPDKLEAYVNYARGDESLEEMYGDEPWRLERLRRLKKEYDPHGRFNFYAPIS